MNILLVCTGNTCRSPMAAALLVKETGGSHIIGSAGIYAAQGMPPSKYALLVMAERGIDISSHKARQLTDTMVRNADLILTMTEAHKSSIMKSYPESASKVHTLGEFAGLPRDVADPYGGELGDYVKSADEMHSMIKMIMFKISSL